jgi:hypothetical protein
MGCVDQMDAAWSSRSILWRCPVMCAVVLNKGVTIRLQPL